MQQINERTSVLSASSVQENPLVIKFGAEKRWVNRKGATDDDKVAKVPYTIYGYQASTTNPKDWSTFAEVAAKNIGVGIVFTPEQTVLGIDIDHCIEDGIIKHPKEALIRELIEKAQTYTEISPSGGGLHLYLSLTAPLTLGANRKAPFEVYTKGRYFTTTFISFEEVRPVRTISVEEAVSLLEIIGYPWGSQGVASVPQDAIKDPQGKPQLEDVELLQRMFSASNGTKTKALYDGDLSFNAGDDSRADFALLSLFAFWTGCNAAQMERLWLGSPLGNREKTQKRKEYRDRSITEAILKCKKVYKASTDKKTSDSKGDEGTIAQTLLGIIDGLENTLLFHDEQGDSYIALETGGHREIWACKSSSVKKWLANEYWNLKKKAPGSEAIKNVIAVLEGRALFDGPLYKLNVRSAWSNGELWYDLTDKKWQAVKINEDGWKVVSDPPILFRRYSHVRPHIIPAATGDVRLFLNYVNIKDSQQQLLLLVHLVSCFIPDFAHPILVVFGSQGSAKSTLSKLLRQVIDPSVIEVASMPDSQKELIQTLAHHAFLFFDNVSYISEVTSDILCKAVTGSGFPKRELYSDDEDIIYSFKRCIGLNGINLVSTRPDLLERSLLIELDRIEDTERKQEKDLLDGFEKDLPQIMGGVFDVLVKALQIRDSIKLSTSPRMADFAVWGCAIAQALGYSNDVFLNAYQNNIGKQTEVVLNDNIVAMAIISFMEDKPEWRGTASTLLYELTNHAAFQHIDTYEKYWPKASNALMRRLNELKINLKKVGISFTSIPGNTREVVLRKLSHSDGTDDNS